MEKETFFNQLDALNESSDNEQDTNDAREVMKQSAQLLSSSFPVSLQPFAARRSQLSGKSKKVPAIQRTTSEPVTSPTIIRETPLPSKKASMKKPRYDQSSPPGPAQSFSNLTPPTTSSSSTPALERSSSTPNLKFQPILAMSNSAGVDVMLKRKTTRVDNMLSRTSTKRKRDEKRIKKQVFAGKTFLLIPNENVGARRKIRIPLFQDHGAVWVKEWTPKITHIVVDDDYNLELTMKHLKPIMKTDTIPANVVLVNESYAVACMEHSTLVDETQPRYQVKSLPKSLEEAQNVKPRAPSKFSSRKSKKRQETPQEGAQRSESESQLSRPHLNMDLADETELGQMIELVRNLEGVLLEDEDEEEEEGHVRTLNVINVQNIFGLSKFMDVKSSSDDSDHEGSSEEDLRPRKSRNKKNGKKKKSLSESEYLRMVGGTGEIIEDNPNRKTIEILERMKDYYERVQDTWRTLAYRRAIGMLKKIPIKIATFDQAIDIPTVGERLAEKIEEIVHTGRLRRLENAEQEPDDLVLQSFLKIYGVGVQQASKFIKKGYKTLDDLRTKAQLTRNQQIGLDRYNDFNTRIPRDEVTALGTIVKEAAKLIDPAVEVIIGGSYRRGAASSGDIDFILTKPGSESCEELLPFLYSLVSHLEADGFLTSALATPTRRREDSGSKWHGACVLPGNPIWRRIDFLLVPETELGAALIYFTGDDLFNRSIRLMARRKGCRLNQRGLYKNVLRGPKGAKMSEGELVEGRDEREIFAFLGVPWRKPEHRICH